ncbi:unnamed protein product [Clonostachys chloroleuca]|uniref:Transcription factor CBF/NF-Y/archaeal histone domain-containing protein n=1 Tax=Clonostachys chloroleuca TaxID=1926264 RepID=A0AA35M7U6_9HYPO|nr:unnamed protein product [Clonostachys chloroleuca]
MSADESSSYAPKSPDLSALFSAAPTDQPPAPPPFSLSQSQNLHQAQHNQNHHQHHHQPSYYPQPQPHAYSVNSAYVPPPTAVVSPSSAHPNYTENIAYIPAHHRPQPQHLQQPPQQQRQFSQLPQQLPPTSYPNHIGAYGNQHQPRSFEPTPLYAQPHHLEQPNRPPVTAELHHLPHATAVPVGAPPQQALHLQTQMPPRRAATAAAVIEEPIIEPSPVRTKFPTARIKRIMQADEEVGKVAQQTPIAVGKALELFMVQLVSTSADIAKDKGSKRVTASMLKQVVERDDQWDFLREIVGKVENEKEGKPKQTKGESESDEDAYEPKKKGRGGRKKKGSV